MKQLITILILLLSVPIAYAQSDGMSYQAVLLDKNPLEIPGQDIGGNYLAETEVTLRFTIQDQNQFIEFQETQITTTDPFGMVNLIIGQGMLSPESAGAFNEINWDGTPKFLIIDLSYDGSDLEELSRQNLLFVPYALHRNIIATQTLDVDGATTLNNTLDVSGATVLNNTLNVTGETILENNLTVDGTTQLNQELIVDGETNLNQGLNVNNSYPTLLSGSLTTQGNTSLNGSAALNGPTTINNTLTANGTTCFNDQVTIKSNESGDDTSYNAYPLRVEGSDQGIAIKVNSSLPDKTNNYISFFNSSGSVIGRIEGQTESNLVNSADYIYVSATLLAAEVAAGANLLISSGGVTVCGGFGVVTCPPSWAEIAVGVADLALAAANAIAYQIFAASNLGVSYQSGSADYAEYLERQNHSERISAGDVVGIRGGLISKDLTNASQILVISTSPAVLGNLPEKVEIPNCEKVAFMGQVPVKVFGLVNIGDYVIPSGNNDGVGIGVSPANITPEQYAQIIGIAWSHALKDNQINRINLSIGLNSNDVAKLVALQQKEIHSLQNAFTLLEQRINALESGTLVNSEFTADETQIIKDVIHQEQDIQAGVYDTYEQPEELSRDQVEESLTMLEELFLDQGVSIKDDFVLNKLFNDPDFKEQVIQETLLNYSYSTKSAGLK